MVISPKDEWSFVTITPGAQSVTMDLELKMQRLYVDNWGFLTKASDILTSFCSSNVIMHMLILMYVPAKFSFIS